MMSFRLLAVLDDMCFIPRMVLMFARISYRLERQLKQIMITLLSASSNYFSE